MKSFSVIVILIFNHTFIVTALQKQDSTQAVLHFQKAQNAFKIGNIESDSIAFVHYQNSLQIFNRLGINSKEVALANLDCGIIKHMRNELLSALSFYNQSISSWKALQKPDASQLWLHRCLIELWSDLNNADSAFYFFSKGLEMTNQFDKGQYKADIFNTYGSVLFKEGNYLQAINHFQEALKFEQSNSGLITIYNNIATSNMYLLRHQEASVVYQKMLALLNNVKGNELTKIVVQQNIAKSMYKNGQLDSALYMIDIAINEYETSGLEHPKLSIKLPLNKGIILQAAGFADEALPSLKTALTIHNQYFSSKSILKAQILKAIGDVYQKQEAYHHALDFYEQATASLSWRTSQDKTIFEDTLSELELFYVKQAQANTFVKLFEIEGDIIRLTKAYESFEQAITLSEIVRKGYSMERSKLFFYQQVYPVFEQALAVAFKLQQNNLAFTKTMFQITERSKAAILTDYRKSTFIKQVTGLPDSLLLVEQRIVREISRLKTSSESLADSSKIARTQGKIRDLEIKLGIINRTYEQYPAYLKLKYELAPVDLAELKSQLSRQDQVLVEYFLGKESVFIFIVDGNDIAVEVIDRKPITNEALKGMIKALYHFQDGQTYQGDAAALELYHQLWLPIEKHLGNNQNILIAADGQLHHIPFDALVTELNDVHYLIHDYNLQYTYSAKLWLNALSKEYRHSNHILAYAPFANNTALPTAQRSQPYTALPSSKAEIEAFAQSIFLNENATKTGFLNNYHQADILHLATHASAIDGHSEMSYIAFYPDGVDTTSHRLRTHELYNLALDSMKLTILSACQTGGGQLINGEGVLSLARGFTLAGCPNIFMTLWEADDKVAANIVSATQANLFNGMEKDRALRKAKIDYIEANRRVRNHPVFWANFVFIGENRPITQSSFFSSTRFLGLFICVIIIAFIILALAIKKRQLAVIHTGLKP